MDFYIRVDQKVGSGVGLMLVDYLLSYILCSTDLHEITHSAYII